MAGSPRESISKDAQKWLNRFANQIDYNRFQRGIALFNNGALTDFGFDDFGFTAKVQGSDVTPYTLEGEIVIEKAFPDLNQYTMSCSCPDDAVFCKHAVCTTLHMMMELDSGKMRQALTSSQKSSRVESKQHQHLEKLSELLKRKNSSSITSLREEKFWPFELSFNNAMQDVDTTIKEILQQIKDKN
jgi:uncharacterized Zn finger protein